MQVAHDVELALDARAKLGEAPSWDPIRGALLWVDITEGLVHRFDPAAASDEVFQVGQPVGAAVPTASGAIALAVHHGFALLDPANGAIQRVAELEGSSLGTMMNDGKCDPAGRFWAGTRDVEGNRPLGSLYRLDPDRTAVRVLTDVTLSNGLGWSPDGGTMYYIDSTTYRIDAMDFEGDTGAVSNRRRLVELPEAWGLPDGMTVDEEGSLWVAFWRGAAVRRFAPDGRLTSIVALPVSQVTSCAFGGDDLSDLYVTSARTGLSSNELEREPHAGGLFRLRPGVRGVPEHPYAGPAT
jgi:sugar lactone lactonase YvrE